MNTSPENQSEDTNALIEQLVSDAAVSLAQGQSRDAVREELMRQGIPLEAATQIINQASSLKQEAFRQKGSEMFFQGIGWMVLGAIITGFTYSMAAPGGTFVVTTGLFVVGGIYIIAGIFRMIFG